MTGHYHEEVRKVVGRVAITLIATAAAFCFGAVAGGAICERWLVPGWIQQYSEGGQVALAVLGYIVAGAFLCAFIAFLVGFMWSVKSARRQQPNSNAGPLF